MRAEDTTQATRAGRPRDPAADRAILDATLHLLAEQGYQAMSIEGVAAASGVSRPTVYRRYASKADLVAAALAGLPSGPEVELPASARPALLELERRTAAALGSTRSGRSSPGASPRGNCAPVPTTK